MASSLVSDGTVATEVSKIKVSGCYSCAFIKLNLVQYTDRIEKKR